MIVLDEGQRIKNWEAKTSQVIKRLRSPFALVLSGTPLENRVDELYSVVEFIDERRLAPAYRFYNRHRVLDELPPRTTEIVRIAPTQEQLELHNSHMQVVSSIINKPEAAVDERGRPTLTVSLPDEEAVARLASTLTRLMGRESTP